MFGPPDKLRGNNSGVPKTEWGCRHLHPETNAKARNTMGLIMRCSILSCETYLWLLPARQRVMFLSRVTTVISLPVTSSDRENVCKQAVSTQ